MALTIQQPTAGVLPINVKLGSAEGGALVATALPAGVTVGAPTAGALPILGAVVMGQIVNGAFAQSLP